MRLFAILGAIVALLLAASALAQPADALRQRIAAVAATAEGRVGMAAIDLDGGATLSVNGGEAFPMASTVKLAVAAAYLDGVDRGRLKLTTLYSLDEAMRVRSDGIADALPHPGVALSAANLIELMLTVSDNTATDVLLKALGGPGAVQRWLERAGVRGQRVDRTIARLLIDVSGKPTAPGLTDAEALARFMPVEPWRPDDEKWPVNPVFDADPRDSSTPEAMAGLLAKLHRGELLSAASTRFLFEVMARCRTGAKRVKALLPKGTEFAHKTGTLPGIANDVGVLTLPNGRRVAIAVLSRGIADPDARERTLAEIGRIVFDGFALAPPPAAEARVAFDRRGVVAAEARGVADRATGRRATVDDPVRVASVSKLVVALGVMRLVEAGKLDLDADVSDRLGWRLRHPAFLQVPITLRLLLSHRSGLTDGVDYIVPLGRRLADVLADPKAWDAAHPPGAYFRYANIGFPVIASVMEAATGERFDRVMQRTVLGPLKLDACYNWGAGCSDAKVARAVVLYRANGEVARDDLHGARPACPVVATDGCDLDRYRLGDNGALFSPQGGLRISMRDLAAIGAMLLRGGDGFLSRASIATLEAPAWRFDGGNGDTSNGFYCAYGLATQSLPSARAECADDLFGDGRRRVGHAGEAYALRSGLWIDRAAGRGVAFFATAVEDGSKGVSAYSREEERLARER